MKRIKRPMEGRISVFRSLEVSAPISGSEMAHDGLQAVRPVHSSGETAVMAADAKGPDFCSASNAVHGNQVTEV